MRIEEHAKRCEQELGKPFTEVHCFLDQFAMKYNMSMAHRMILHHRLGVEVVGLEFGPEAKEAAKLHIRDDLWGLLPTGPEWFLAQDNYLPTSGQEDSMEEDIKNLLGYAPDFNLCWVTDWHAPSFKCSCGYKGPTPNGAKQCPWCDMPKTERFSMLLQKTLTI
ncbi:hypothetical protein DPQ33_17985 [Oceanidesulfovibrio indonesiensis]|uniref:Uncharacterized protein n=1 Tax=Oceanidesulfovibrio indonesiensis TaxID=54767 RepID=A0A7M3M9Y9_9BACT|nr:hypothetical protein [Oceanidesulfovibrio indonesiensis]TVM14023.1 hypothetical protein DPQ33_17985 [Oceanidesulfovibrio indonesiensis]